MASVNELRDQRNRALIAVYELTEGSSLKSAMTADVADRTGLTDDAIEAAVQWLTDRNLLSYVSLAGDFTVTPTGSDEAERLLSDGEDPVAAVLTIRERQVLEAF